MPSFRFISNSRCRLRTTFSVEAEDREAAYGIVKDTFHVKTNEYQQAVPGLKLLDTAIDEGSCISITDADNGDTVISRPSLRLDLLSQFRQRLSEMNGRAEIQRAFRISRNNNGNPIMLHSMTLNDNDKLTFGCSVNEQATTLTENELSLKALIKISRRLNKFTR